MRLFVALDTTPAVARKAEEIRRLVEAHAGEVARGLRWVAATQLHITLRFIGEVDEAFGGRCAGLLAEPFPVPPFECHALGPEWLPGPRRARVFVLGLGGDLARLESVKGALDGRLERLGLVPEARRFRAHVTLARVREPSGSPRADVAQALVERGAALDPVPFPVARVVLYRSRLSPRGPTYEALAEARLRAPEAAS
jgi:RNA 2',3'-cyclic 3'-phosphodiesterase